jgi:hypothetical protein
MAWPTEEHIEFRMKSICESGEDRIFQRFDELHGIHIDDTQVIRWLRANGRREMADQYIEWSGALDPDREDDNTTTNPVVPDPGDAPSYEPLARVMASGGALTYSKPEGVSE